MNNKNRGVGMVRISGNYTLLSLLTGILLYAGWSNLPTGFFTFFAFVPLLYLEHKVLRERGKASVVFRYAYLAFFIWNLLSTWWIYYATFPGAVAAVVFNSLFYTVVFWLYHLTRRKLGNRAGDFAFIAYWIAFEYVYLHGEISWVWLVLGNAFANIPQVIQWYEYTGTLGGSLWVLLINLVVFRIIVYLVYKEKTSRRLVRFRYVFLAILLIVPVVLSLVRYYSWKNTGDKVEVVVVQPNIDPYSEKFSGRISPLQQVERIVTIADSLVTDSTEYVVAPETAIPVGIWESQLKDNYLIKPFYALLQKHKNLNIVVGATTYKNYGTEQKTPTSRPIFDGKDTLWYDAFNSALHINNKGIEVYHKSKLVIGVEMLPYPQYLTFLKYLSIDLGGTTGSLGTQKDRTVFTSYDNKVKPGAVICYESIYGEFVTGYVKNGANLLFVITNDGWWNDSPGYKQHFSYSRIRAIETRKSIARSANTGISAFINSRGDVIQKTGWWTYTAIKNKVTLNTKKTFYVKYGDYIGRISLTASVLVFLFFALKIFAKSKKYV